MTRSAGAQRDEADLKSESPLETGSGKIIELVRNPALKRLFMAVVLISASWDVHQFIVPLYGAQHGFLLRRSVWCWEPMRARRLSFGLHCHCCRDIFRNGD